MSWLAWGLGLSVAGSLGFLAGVCWHALLHRCTPAIADVQTLDETYQRGVEDGAHAERARAQIATLSAMWAR